MPTKTRLDTDVEAPADAPPVADAVPAVEAAAPEPVAATAEESEDQRPHSDDLWQAGPWVALTYTGDPKVYIPLGELAYGDVRNVPAPLAESYLATRDFVPAAA